MIIANPKSFTVKAIDLCLIISFAQCIPPDENTIEIKKWQFECLDEAKVDPDLVIKLKAGNWKIKDISLEKWALCVMVKSGIMSQDGVFRIDEASLHVPEDEQQKVMKMADVCLPKKRMMPHEIAWHYLECINRPSPRDFFLLSESEGLKKYAHCMLVKAELMTKNGEFKKEVALANVPAGMKPINNITVDLSPLLVNRPAVEILIDTWLAEKGNTPQDTAWNYIKCFHEKDPKHATIL